VLVVRVGVVLKILVQYPVKRTQSYGLLCILFSQNSTDEYLPSAEMVFLLADVQKSEKMLNFAPLDAVNTSKNVVEPLHCNG
jgi:hypothetical protein